MRCQHHKDSFLAFHCQIHRAFTRTCVGVEKLREFMMCFKGKSLQIQDSHSLFHLDCVMRIVVVQFEVLERERVDVGLVRLDYELREWPRLAIPLQHQSFDVIQVNVRVVAREH